MFNLSNKTASYRKVAGCFSFVPIMGNKNLTIDIAKGIAIILVVYGHVIEHSMAPWNEDFFQNPVFKVIYTFHMPLFVFISGYLMANSLSRHSIGEVFRSRCKSLLVPFLSLAILGSIVIFVLNMMFGNNAGRVDLTGILADQLFLDPQVWFLLTLFVLSGVLIYSVRLEKRLGTFIFVPIYFLLMIIPYNNECALYYVKWFYLFYLAGYFLNRSGIKIPSVTFKTMLMLVSVALFSWLVTYWDKNDYIYINKMNFASDHYLSEFLRLIFRYFVGFLGIFIVFNIAEYFSKTKASSFLGVIGIYSLDIYIIQMFIVEGIYPRLIHKAGIHLDFNSPCVLYILAPVMTMLFAGACILISKLLIRKSRLLNSLLLGGRTSDNVDNRRV